jgi:protein-S-isoprenylcysteine O-methyltransferase Ste14
MKKIRLFATLYFAVQGVAVLAWWILLFSAPSSRKYFQMGESETTLLAFWLPDLFLLAVGSFAVSAFVWFENRFTVIAVWFVVGAIAYATFYCLAFAMMTDSGWLGVVLMFPAMIWSGNFAIGLSPAFHEKMFRISKETTTSWILMKTFAQIVVVWSLILFVFPMLIVWIETKIGIAQFAFPFQKIFSAILFVLLSSVGVSGALTMAKIGRGTPLPLDSASKLVVAGIYAFVRNPMAISGIGQGLAVGLFLGSPLVLLYALMGGAIWQMIFRQLEEEDLHEKFGADFEKYRANVCCWIPRLKRFEL